MKHLFNLLLIFELLFTIRWKLPSIYNHLISRKNGSLQEIYHIVDRNNLQRQLNQVDYDMTVTMFSSNTCLTTSPYGNHHTPDQVRFFVYNFSTLTVSIEH